MDFRSKFAELSADKGVLCVNLDPALPEQKMPDSIPSKYTKGHGSGEARLNFCLDMIDLVKDYAVAIKPNQQFISGISEEQNHILTEYARKADLLSIKDYKLSDIGNTVSSAVFHLSLEGYDAITFNPLFGNLQESVKVAHASNLGIIVITLPSNPEAELFMRKALVNGRPLYEEIANQAKAFDADGCVVGATGHVTAQDVRTIVKLAGDDKVLLVPGIGAQGGDASKFAGTNVMISVGRDIIYNENPRARAAHYAHVLASYKKKR
jgi:orotidine 5'-phosphate decarboxylase subfamily 2